MNTNTHAQNVLSWRESFVTLPNNHFFELIRMYLGEIKTPYNKQKLVEELSSFLRKAETKKTIVALLDDDDICILGAIALLQKPTQDKLCSFFASDFSFANLYEKLLNLEERLLIYRKNPDKTVFGVNPLLEETLLPILRCAKLLPVANAPRAESVSTHQSAPQNAPRAESVSTNQSAQTNPPQENYPTQLLLASIYSFFLHEDDTVKQSGELKKRAEALIAENFAFTKTQQGKTLFNALVLGMKNLNLLQQDLFNLKPNEALWANFAELDFCTQWLYLAVSACGVFTKDALFKQANLLRDIICSIPDAGFEEHILRRSAILQAEKNDDKTMQKQSRFASLFVEKTPLDEKESPNKNDILQIIKCLKDTGLVSVNKNVYKRSFYFDALCKQQDTSTFAHQNASVQITIDADFSVSILSPATKIDFAPILHLMHFMRIQRYDTVPCFEITRQTCFRAFDLGFAVDDVLGACKKFASHDLSQNLIFCIEDWSKTYHSASLYKGYVLKVDAEKRIIIENNATLKPFIRQKLCEGVYLLDFADDDEAYEKLKKANLDFVGRIKNKKIVQRAQNFLPLKLDLWQSPQIDNLADAPQTNTSQTNTPCAPFADEPNTNATVASAKNANAILQAMRDELEKITCTQEQKETLALRIERKIVLSPVQLRADSVRFEKIEASGMDFLGKIHVIEYAISSKSMIELHYDDVNGAIIAMPCNLEKNETDARVTVEMQDGSGLKSFSVSKAQLVKRIRGAVFKEKATF